MESAPELITIEQLAERLSVAKTWIYNQTRQTGPGAIPRVRCGKYLRFVFPEVVEWLRQRTKSGMEN